MALLNIVSLPKHVDELRISKLFMYFDLFANETRPDSSISDGLVNICAYNIIRKDRSRRGGGVCVYLRCSINYKTKNDLVANGLKAVCLEISKPNSRNFIAASVCRPPDASSSFFYAFEKMIGLIADENKEIHILGDLNCDMFKSVFDQPTKTLKTIYEAYQLSQLITEGTRKANRSCTLIDHYQRLCQRKSIFPV